MITLFMLAAMFREEPQKTPAPKPEIRAIAESGRCADVGEKPDGRVAPPPVIAPGLPPILSFRLYEGKRHGRFNNSDLMLDDAGH
jgi:hypothetical protein